MGRVTLVALVTMTGLSCHVPSRPATDPDPVQMYTFPLTLPNETLVCVESIRDGLRSPCLTLGYLRELALDRAAN